MARFTVHGDDTAPEESKALFEKSKAMMGMVPNMHRLMAENPAFLEAYQETTRLYLQGPALTSTEKHVVWVALSVYHECEYCVPAHSALAMQAKVPQDLVEALRQGAPLGDEKLEALRTFALQVADKRGDLDDSEVETFLNAGYSLAAVQEVLLGLSQKVLANYINRLNNHAMPLDDAFAPLKWSPAS